MKTQELGSNPNVYMHVRVCVCVYMCAYLSGFQKQPKNHNKDLCTCTKFQQLSAADSSTTDLIEENTKFSMVSFDQIMPNTRTFFHRKSPLPCY